MLQSCAAYANTELPVYNHGVAPLPLSVVVVVVVLVPGFIIALPARASIKNITRSSGGSGRRLPRARADRAVRVMVFAVRLAAIARRQGLGVCAPF